MKILITGAAGAIGSHLAEKLLLLGHEVVGADAMTSYYDPRIKEHNVAILQAKGITVHRINLATDTLVSVLDGVEVVFHLAGQPGIAASTPFSEYLTNNIIATERLLEVCAATPTLQHFINGATSSVYGVIASGDETTEPKPTSHYGVTKLAAEQLAMALHRTHGFPATSLRFFSVYGERERPDKFFHKLIKAIAEESELTFYEGSDKHIRSYSYVGDIVDGCVLILEHPEHTIGEIFNLGTDVTATTGEGLAIVEELIGKKARINTLPPRIGDQQETAANIGKIRRVLGYEPKTLLRDGLARQIEWYANNIHGNFE